MTSASQIFNLVWRSAFVGAGYIFASMVSGMLFGMLGLLPPVSGAIPLSLAWLFVAALLLGLFLGLLAARTPASLRQHLGIWTGVIFFNMGAVVLEGAFFAPELVQIPVPILIAQQFVAAGTAALLIALLFAQRNQQADMAGVLSRRPWFAWLWRIVLASASYLLFYLLFGALNYAFVTEPYYASHAGGLTTPDAATVLRVELVRAPLLVLSIVPFVLAWRVPRRQLMLTTGFLLFWIGGVVPLLLQMGMLPVPLLLASAVEIFLQNFLTGVVAAALLWLPASTINEPMPAQLLPTVETARLWLRPMQTDDFAALLQIFTDPKVMASFGGELFTPAQMQEWLDSNLEHQTHFGYGLFAVIRKTDGLLVGDCGLEQMTVDGALIAELGYDFRSDAWNHGYATEAACAVRDYAFGVLQLPQLLSLIRVGNQASKRVAEKVGMQPAGEVERYGIRYWRFALQNPRGGQVA